MMRTKNNVLKSTTVFAQGYFTFRPAIEVVEDCRRQTTASQRTEILDAYDARRRDGICRPFVQGAPSFLSGKPLAAALSGFLKTSRTTNYSSTVCCRIVIRGKQLPSLFRNVSCIQSMICASCFTAMAPHDYVKAAFKDGLSPCPMISFAEVPAVR